MASSLPFRASPLPHQQAAMRVMDGAPRGMLEQAMRGLKWFMIVFVLLAGLPTAMGSARELAAVAVVAGGFVTLLGILPMVVMLVVFYAPAPILLALRPLWAHACPTYWLDLTPSERASGLERPPRASAHQGR